MTTVSSDSVTAICDASNICPFIETLPVTEEAINMNISALHNESFQSVNVIQEHINDPDISYWYAQVYNNYKPNKDEIPPTP